MIWVGAIQRTGSLSRLEPYRGDVRPVTVYTHTFVMGGRDNLADDREDPFFTGTGSTPQEAEAQARAVYLKAISCTHRMTRKTPMLLECEMCGVQQRTPLTAQPAAAAPEAAVKAGKRSRRPGLLGWWRSA
ncbi:hypothetical protein [Deinococcus cavernae]|uniref:hypothetical protein n=1 Tax=Deinococcus cavernae TaxID=2320857 RepID=UPI0018F46C98|nr:hypothetical protein [Deinococcus cavernae]